MARKLRNEYNIDLLRLCYKQPEGLFEGLIDTKPNTKIPREGYYLYILRDEENESEEKPTSIMCNLISDDGVEIGTMVFNGSNSKYGRLCFFRFCNKALYDVVLYDYQGNKSNLVACVDYIAEDLGLEFVSITELHIANDSNINKIAKLMHYKRDIANYDMIVNHKRVSENREKINGYKEVFQSSRQRKLNPSIYIEQKKDNAPKLCCYNKSIEIAEESGKDYVTTWNDFGNQTIYRSELRLRWEYIKEYFDEKGVHGYEIFFAILRQEILAEMFEHFSTRLVYFKNKRTNDIVTLTNVA